jgi:hypothetical protein
MTNDGRRSKGEAFAGMAIPLNAISIAFWGGGLIFEG